MSTAELRNKLIATIGRTENTNLLQEAYRLLELESDDFAIYPLNDPQRSAVEESRNQIAAGDFLTDEPATKDIDEWLSK